MNERKLETSRSLGMAICEALGLDADVVCKLVLTVEKDDMPRLTVEQFVRDTDGALVKAVKNFTLHPDPELVETTTLTHEWRQYEYASRAGEALQ